MMLMVHSEDGINQGKKVRTKTHREPFFSTFNDRLIGHLAAHLFLLT